MKALKQLYYSFPVQLFVRHLKSNQLILGSWIMIVLVTTQNFGRVYGIPYLFLDPEYLDHVGFLSFYMVGITFGGFIVAFHISCYILYGSDYSFIGILEKPFSKFSINNSLIPLITLIVYVVAIIRFQIDNEYSSTWNIISMIVGLMLGITSIFILLYLYFSWTNKDIFKYLAGEVDRTLKKNKLHRQKALNQLKESKTKTHQVESYLDLKLKVNPTSDLFYFYDKDAILKVFNQNHFNSVVIETTLIAFIFLLRFFIDIPYFQIPAAASVLLMLTIFTMLTGAVSYWFHKWSIAVSLVIFFLINMLMKSGVINAVYETPGLDYDVQKADYSIETLKQKNSYENIEKDKIHTLQILENWKAKWPEGKKQKMIFLCVSGGGQRAALWTFNSLLHADSLLHGKLMDHTILITGASGGAFGAAYFRELKLSTPQFDKHAALNNISKDNLNPIIFSLVVNDLILRNQFYTYEGKKYLKDRGYEFENQLNSNTDFVLDKKLIDYKQAEFQSRIPMMILGPTVSLDGRKLYMSPQPVTYMNIFAKDREGHIIYKNSSVDFLQFFKDQKAENLKILTALRMNASFPYVTPNLTLPSKPVIEIMDAGVSDNFGISDALKFLYNFKDWIADNTSGVIILSVRDTRKDAPIQERSNLSILERISVPISSVYNNLGNSQDISNDYKLTFANEWFGGEIDLIGLEYNTLSIFEKKAFINKAQEIWQKELERASLSWHLTKKEKTNIINNIHQPSNQESLRRLKELVEFSESEGSENETQTAVGTENSKH
ncbi:patatin-like phospholipase family protein [Reichenbachiella sp. MALMAid0571]|uniref:patatin-like phospholipase family protein n=1 Tax=Reichenbachiella sp. MALMAid0571 TaxID=3143939 RepID=UPI0032E03105